MNELILEHYFLSHGFKLWFKYFKKFFKKFMLRQTWFKWSYQVFGCVMALVTRVYQCLCLCYRGFVNIYCCTISDWTSPRKWFKGFRVELCYISWLGHLIKPWNSLDKKGIQTLMPHEWLGTGSANPSIQLDVSISKVAFSFCSSLVHSST